MDISAINMAYTPNFLLAENQEISSSPTSIITYGRFLEYLKNGWVKRVDFYNDSKFVILEAARPESGYQKETIGVNVPNQDIKLIRQLKEANIDFDVHSTDEPTAIGAPESFNFFGVGLLVAGLVFAFFFLSQFSTDDPNSPNSRSGNNPFNPFGFRQFFKTNSRSDSIQRTGVVFDDVAGIDEIREEFQEIVSFLKNADRYRRVGAKIPKGVLLSGPPGTGKTLLAKAIAGEAEVPFFSCSASEFVELFVGIGASRIRELFKKAKAKTPCIIFIDEIDAVGRERGFGVGGGNDEREQTLNQLLTEMDGFETNNGVIVIAATNRVDILDSALLRPGRFDRQLQVGLPDVKSRVSILKVHAKNKKLGPDIDLLTIAKRTGGFSGADLANLLNEAAILTARYSEKAINARRVNEALDKITVGLAQSPAEENRYKRIVAYHESGHALAASLLEYHDPVERISLIPRGRARSLTTFVPNEDTMYSRNQLITRLISLLAGRAAEEVIFGKAEVTTLAVDDIQRATYLARQLVTEFGMSPLGPIAFSENQTEDIMMRGAEQTYSDELTSAIDTVVRLHLEHAYNEAFTLLQNNRVLLDELVNLVMSKENVEGYEIRALIASYQRIKLLLPASKLGTKTGLRELLRQEMEVLVNNSEYNLKFQALRSPQAEEKLFNEILDQAAINIKSNPEFSKMLTSANS